MGDGLTEMLLLSLEVELVGGSEVSRLVDDRIPIPVDVRVSSPSLADLRAANWEKEKGMYCWYPFFLRQTESISSHALALGRLFLRVGRYRGSPLAYTGRRADLLGPRESETPESLDSR